MAKTIDKSPQDWCITVNAEIATIKLLHPDPAEAIYRWIDNAIGIPQNSLAGGILAGIDGLPVYMYAVTGRLYCTSVPLVPYMFRKMNFKELPILCGIAKYDSTTGNFLKAILLKSWPSDMRVKLRNAIKQAYEYTKTLSDEDERQP